MTDLKFYFEHKNNRTELRNKSLIDFTEIASDKEYASNVYYNNFVRETESLWSGFDYYPKFVEKRKLNKNYTEVDFIREEIINQSMKKKDILILAEYFADYEFHCKLIGWNPFTNVTEKTTTEFDFDFKWNTGFKEFDFIRIAIGFYYSDILKNESEDHSTFIRNFAKALNYPLNESNLHSNIAKLILSKSETNDRIFDKLGDGIDRFIKTKSK